MVVQSIHLLQILKEINNSKLNEIRQEQKERRDDKVSQIESSWERKNLVIPNDLSKSYNAIKSKGKLYFKYKDDLPKTEQYLVKIEQTPQSPSPQTYFKVKKEVFTNNKFFNLLM